MAKNIDSNGNLVGGLADTLAGGDKWAKAVMNDARYPNSTVFNDWLIPDQAEERHIGQQLLLDEYEPSVKMRGLVKAGINPLTAAAGLAGSGGSSALPQSNESVNPLGDVAGAVGAVAGAAQNVVGAVSGMAKLPFELKNIDSDSASKLAAAGLSNAQTQGVLTDNTYKDEDWKTRLNVQRQQFENMKQELTNLQASHREIMTHCDEMIAQIELNGSVKEYNEALMLKVQEETRWMKELNDWRISHNLHITESGIDGYIFDMALNGADLSQFDKFIEIYSEWRGSTQRAISDAQNESEINTAFDKAFNKALAENDIAAKFAPFFGDIEVLRETLKEAYKELLENPGNPLNFVGKLLNLLYQGAVAIQVPKNVQTGSPEPPIINPKQR